MRGLRPKTWICVGAGYSREDIKATLLKDGEGFVGDAVTTLPDLCARIVGCDREHVLTPLSRQEVLRMLLSNRRIIRGLPEARRLKRQRGFYRKLDAAIQAGRMTFAHPEEAEVLAEFLTQRLGANPIRDEVRMLAHAYEAWLKESKLWDAPLLIRAAREVLVEQWPAGVPKPEEIQVFSTQATESLEKSFWEDVQKYVCVSFGSLGESSSRGPSVRWERWHTLDDAADGFADRLVEVSAEKLHDLVVLIPDVVSVRRALSRALQSRRIPLADPRDPHRLRMDEGIKSALLPLQVVARNYERTDVLSFLRGFPDNIEWAREINSRGVRNGLRSYRGGLLAQAHDQLLELEKGFGGSAGRKICSELAEAHLDWLGGQAQTADQSVVRFFEEFWQAFIRDTTLVGQANRRAPLLYWLEKVQARINETPAPVERLKPEYGVAVYRLQQAPIPARYFGELWLFGLPPQLLTGESVGDYWFSERERDVLSSEFGVRSSIQAREECIRTLRSWFACANEINLLDAHYDFDGRERESIFPVLKELGISNPETEVVPIEKGAHGRWIKSYGALRAAPPQEVKLDPIVPATATRVVEMTATTLDRYSRCPFLGLAQQRWKLWDLREPDTELWPDVRGNILHSAVKSLLESRDQNGQFTVAIGEALDRAWKANTPKGLFRGERIEKYVRSRLEVVLHSFCEDEREYFDHTHSKTISLEDLRFRLSYPEFAITGEPDRIEELSDGLFISDFKTSSLNPKGKEMLELGYRLQLPFYAIAAKRELGKQVIGLQFIELTPRGSRGKGIFFKRYNGKEAGKPTNVRSNSTSLFVLEPDEAWSRLEEQIVDHARNYLGGNYDPKPKKDDECRSCAVNDLCGSRRMVREDET